MPGGEIPGTNRKPFTPVWFVSLAGVRMGGDPVRDGAD